LGKHPEIKECVVVPHGQGTNKMLAAFYVARENGAVNVVGMSGDALKKYLQQFLPDYMLPAVFVSLPSIPLTQNGKIDRRALQSMEVGKERQQEYLALSDHERRIVEIWAQVLERKSESIGVNDNFFDVGGNSISAVALAASIEKVTG